MLGDRGGVSRGGSPRRRMGCGKRAAAIHALLLLRLWSRAAYVETTKQAQRAAKKHGFAIGQSSDILLHPPLPSVAVPIAMERGRRRKKTAQRSAADPSPASESASAQASSTSATSSIAAARSPSSPSAPRPPGATT